MKILLLITDLDIGGTPTVVRDLAIRLPADVACLAPAGPVADQIRAAGRSVVSFNARSAPDLPRAVIELVLFLHREKIDVVFSFLIHANTVAALASPFCRGVRFIQSIQTTQSNPRWHWRLQSIVHHAADTIVVPSPSAARAAKEWSNIPPDKIAIISNAVEMRTPSPATAGEGRGEGGFEQGRTFNLENGPHPNPPPEYRARRPENGRRVGFIGRLDPIKRITDLIEAIALLPMEFTLDIFGKGDDRRAIEEMVRRLQLASRVTLHGAIADPAEAFNQIDTLVLPSAAEGFGLVLIEAMAAGVPVIATDVPGIRDVILRGQNGLLVPVAAPPAIAKAIHELQTDAMLRQRLITAGRGEVAIRFSWEHVLPQYRRLLDEKKHPRMDTNAHE